MILKTLQQLQESLFRNRGYTPTFIEITLPSDLYIKLIYDLNDTPYDKGRVFGIMDFYILNFPNGQIKVRCQE